MHDPAFQLSINQRFGCHAQQLKDLKPALPLLSQDIKTFKPFPQGHNMRPLFFLACPLDQMKQCVGDLIHKFLVEPGMGRESTAVTIGTFLIGVGGLLFTLGLVGVVVDCYRLLPVILSPPLSSSDVLGHAGGVPAAASGAAQGRPEAP